MEVRKKGGVEIDRGQMGLQPQHMCCATMYILVPIYQADNALRMGLQRKGKILSLSESIGVCQMWLDDVENIEDNEDKAQRCLGPEDILYSNWGTGKIHVGSYTMRTGVQEQTLKQSTYQISRSFTTCACAIFMGQRSNIKNEPCGSRVLSQWLTEQRGREGRHQNESPGGPKDDRTESEGGAEWSMW